MKVLVTGAAGFISMHVAAQLLARSDAVVGIDNLNDYYGVSLKTDRLRTGERLLMSLGANQIIRLSVAVALIALLGFSMPAIAQGSRDKKIIYYGWGLPDTQYVRDHWREMEAMPLDGLGILVAIDREAWQRGVKGDSNQLGRQVMGQRQFRAEDFRESINDLKAARWHSFTDNFLPVALSLSASAEGLNWFDDARWHTVENNFRIVAKIAADGRAKGLIFDPEHYGYMLFSYQSQSKQVDHTYEEYQRMARQRGREVMKAIASEFPDATLLSFYGHTLLLKEFRGRRSFAEADYNLLPAFYDGLLEAMGPRACLYDGFEFSYGYKQRERFLEGYSKIHQSGVSISSVPDRYRKNVRAAFGLWLDRDQQFAYFTPQEFQNALAYALETSDRYVWIYGQSFRFFPPSKIPSSFIESIAAARRAARRP